MLSYDTVTEQRSLEKYGVLRLNNSSFMVNGWFTRKYHFDHWEQKLTFPLKNWKPCYLEKWQIYKLLWIFLVVSWFCNCLQSHWGRSSFITCSVASESYYTTYMGESHRNFFPYERHQFFFPYEEWQNNDKSQDLNCSLWTTGLWSILSFCCLSFSI